MRAERGALAPHLADRVRPVALAEEQVVPLLPALEALLPSGLRRGSTMAVGGARRGAGATSLALALTAAPSAAGSWVAVVGLPSLGLLAAAELGVALERLAMVAAPDARSYPLVVATLVDAFDVVVVGGAGRLRPADGRRLAARARERGSVLVVLGDTIVLEPDITLDVVAASWEGLGRGHGHLRARRVVVEASGRRAASRPRRAELWLPAADGGVVAVEPVAEAVAEVRPLREAG